MERYIEYLLDRYYQMQEHRLATNNQIRALREAKMDVKPLMKFSDDFYAIECEIAKTLEQSVREHIMYSWLKEVKGIGPIMSAALVCTIDITKAEHASSLWKYAGLAPGQKRVKGQKLDWNPFLKKTCWLIGKSFVKTKGEYRGIYDTSKKFYQKKFPKEVKEGNRVMYTKGHIDAMARRRTVKLFLSAFWAEWRKLEDLPVSEPFAHRIEASDGKKTKITKRASVRKTPIKGKRAIRQKKTKQS